MDDKKPDIIGGGPNWNLAVTVACEECANTTFVQGVYLRRLSKIVACSEKDMIRPVPTFVCAKCGHVNKEFKIDFD